LEDGDRKEEEDGGRVSSRFLERDRVPDAGLQVLGEIAPSCFFLRYASLFLQVDGGSWRGGEGRRVDALAAGWVSPSWSMLFSDGCAPNSVPADGNMARPSAEAARDASAHPRGLHRHGVFLDVQGFRFLSGFFSGCVFVWHFVGGASERGFRR
jgi:hypothetical protein